MACYPTCTVESVNATLKYDQSYEQCKQHLVTVTVSLQPIVFPIPNYSKYIFEPATCNLQPAKYTCREQHGQAMLQNTPLGPEQVCTLLVYLLRG